MNVDDVKTEKDLAKYGAYLMSQQSDKKITDKENYDLYNKAFEKVYGHPAFYEDGNFYN